jgi:hypothetical protein
LFNCTKLGWYAVVVIILSLIFSNLVILQRAYLSQCRQTWVIVAGVVAILPFLGFIVATIGYSYVEMSEENGCVAHYPDILPYLWFGGVVPVNLLFGGIFCHVAYKQYRMFGTDAWKRLARDGIQVMVIVTGFNLIFAFCVFARVGGGKTEIFFVLDW